MITQDALLGWIFPKTGSSSAYPDGLDAFATQYTIFMALLSIALLIFPGDKNLSVLAVLCGCICIWAAIGVLGLFISYFTAKPWGMYKVAISLCVVLFGGICFTEWPQNVKKISISSKGIQFE